MQLARRDAPHLKAVADNVVPLRAARGVDLAARRRRGVRWAVSAAFSIAVHAVLLVAIDAPSTPDVSPPVPLEVMLVEAPAPTPAPARQPPPIFAVPERKAMPPVKREPQVVQRKAAESPAAVALPRLEPSPMVEPPAPPAPVAAPSAPPRTEPAPAGSAGGPPGVRTPAAAPPSSPSFSAAYLRNPPPRYPLIARRNGEQGTVTLRVRVTRDGLPESVVLDRTSGSGALDAAALATVKEWRFVPAQHNGQAVDATVLVPIVFRLQDAQ